MKILPSSEQVAMKSPFASMETWFTATVCTLNFCPSMLLPWWSRRWMKPQSVPRHMNCNARDRDCQWTSRTVGVKRWGCRWTSHKSVSNETVSKRATRRCQRMRLLVNESHVGVKRRGCRCTSHIRRYQTTTVSMNVYRSNLQSYCTAVYYDAQNVRAFELKMRNY